MKNSTVHPSFSVLIPDGERRIAFLASQCFAGVKNVKVYVLAKNPEAPIRFSRYVTQFFTYNPAEGESEQGYLDAIYNTAKKVKADLILPADDATIRLLIANKERFINECAISLLPDLTTFDAVTHKWQLAKILTEQNIPAPVTLLYENSEQFAVSLSNFTFPVILKPAHGRAGQGVMLFGNSNDLIDFAKKNTSTADYIVQSFIEGYNICFNVLCKNGKILAYTIQKEVILGYGAFEPALCMDFIHDDMAYKTIEGLMRKLNWSGMANIDMRYDENDGKMKLIEINPRFWGAVLGSVFVGVNFPYLTCLSALGFELPEVNYRYPKRYAKNRAAVDILLKRLKTRDKNFYYDGSELRYLIRNPLPKLWETYLSYRDAIKQKCN